MKTAEASTNCPVFVNTMFLLSVGFYGIACSADDDTAEDADGELSETIASSQSAPTPPVAPPPPPAGSISVCERPESAYFDAGTSAWYVSCQAKADVADDGYVSKLNADATAVVTERFISGLDDPKGIRVQSGKLYVSNVNELVTADVLTGAILATTSVVGIDARVAPSPFLNDVAVDPATGDVYVSDSCSDTIYRFDADGGSPQLLIQSPLLEGPNGLLVDDDGSGIPAF